MPYKFDVYQAISGQLPDPLFERDLAYLQKKTGGKRLLVRADVVPSEIRSILSEILFLTPVYDNDGNVRDVSIQLEGTKVSSFYGELTGKSVGDGLDANMSSRVVAAVSACVKSKRPTIAELILRSEGYREVIVRSLYMPLSEDGKTIDRCFAHFRIKHNSLLAIQN